MKLIYAYVKQYRNIFNQEIAFSDDYHVHLSEGKLHIEKNEDNHAKQFLFGDTVLADLHIIIGRTGSGKTNLLQLIGMDEHERTHSSQSKDAYLLLYAKPEGRYVAEIFNMKIEGLEPSKQERASVEFVGYDWGRILEFEYDATRRRIINAKGIQGANLEQVDKTIIVNGFDRHAFTQCPYRDERREGIEGSNRLLPRYIAPFERTPLSMVSEYIKDYVEQQPENSIKRKSALIIRHDNWLFDFLNVDIDQRVEENEYWTYVEKKREDSIQSTLRKKKNETQYPSPKECFIHDLLTAFAKYLRYKAAGINPNDPRSKGHPLVDLGIKNPTILPDGHQMSVEKRIDWLCQYIDYHFDDYHGNKGLVWQIGTDIVEIANCLRAFDDKYFTDEQFTLPIVEMDFSKGSPLYDLIERMDQFRPDEYGIFDKELLPCHFSYLSSGEYQYAKIWGAIEEFGNKIKIANQQYYNRPKKYIQPNFILLLDEPETFMHPEMCRQFISKMYRILSKRQPETNMQVILTTHSPFMLSDVMSSQVTRVDYNEKGECVVVPESGKSYFAANIHTIMADGFFLDYTIGEYAREYLTEKFRFLQEISNRHPQITPDEWEKVQQIKEIVPFIGDEMIRNSFTLILRFLGHAQV